MNFKKLNFTLAMIGIFAYCESLFALNFSNNTSTNAAIISPSLQMTQLQSTNFQWDNSLDISITNQVSKQINRQISRNVTEHIFENFISENQSEKDGFKFNDLWTNFSWSTLINDAKTLENFDTAIYQSAVGIDKKIGDFYLGTTVGYVATNTDFSNLISDVKQTINVTPYAAYKINNNFFVSALSGYLYTNSTATSSIESNIQANISEVDVNSFHMMDNWFMKGKLGGRYYHSDMEMNHHQTNQKKELNASDWTFLTDLSGGYQFDNDFKISTGVLYESTNTSTALKLDSNSFYYNAGVDYLVSKDFSFGAKLQTDLSNTATDVTTIGLNMRLEM